MTWNAEDAQKGGFEHFMLKEIFEEPQAIHNSLLGALDVIENGEILPNVQFRFHQDRRLRHLLPCRHGGQVHHGGIGQDTDHGGAGLRVPLFARGQGVPLGGAHIPERGDRRHPGRRPGGEAPGLPDLGDHQRGRAAPSPGRWTRCSTPGPDRRSASPPPRPTSPS